MQCGLARDSALARSWDFDLSKVAGLDGHKGSLNQDSGSLDATDIVGRKLKNTNGATSESLLVAYVLVGGDEQVELAEVRRS
jgi:hypothetical protein